ncbi:MAG: hypothetical protein HDR08_10465 [Lachnospiraceae bacterium]|nr:hypothetical protein [Lachnospiraceae bacterium]MBD5511660.1 hypothetical protein [Lachnospiraceae bacterium]
MGILSGYKKFKKYLRTADGYRLCSEWTKSDTVEMTDGSTLQESMDTVVSDVESTQNELKTSLGGMTFGVDAAGRYGYIKAGADTVTPFKSHANVINFNPTWTHIGSSTNNSNASVSTNGNTMTLINNISGDYTAFSATFRSVEKYDFEGCIGIIYSVNANAYGSTYNQPITVTINGTNISSSFTASQLGALKYYFFYLDEDSRPGEGDNYIYATVTSAYHTTGYGANRLDMNLFNWYLVT